MLFNIQKFVIFTIILYILYLKKGIQFQNFKRGLHNTVSCSSKQRILSLFLTEHYQTWRPFMAEINYFSYAVQLDGFLFDRLSSLSPLTREVLLAPHMTLQQYLPIRPCFPLPSENLQTPFDLIISRLLSVGALVFSKFVWIKCKIHDLIVKPHEDGSSYV